jgi:RNA polymerase sigma factor (sigma-70 family)
MTTTHLSLLQRARDSGDEEAWQRLVEVYSPLLRQWLQQYQVQAADAEDLLQEVLQVVLRELPDLQTGQRPGAFRNWLRKVLVNRLRNYWRQRDYRPVVKGGSSVLEQLNQLEDETSELSRVWSEEHDQLVMARVLELVRPRFQEKTWEAFRRQMFLGERADAVAVALDMPISSVYVARSRVLSALRQESQGLLDSA